MKPTTPTAAQLATYIIYKLERDIYNRSGLLLPILKRAYTNGGRKLQKELNEQHNTNYIRYGKYLEPSKY